MSIILADRLALRLAALDAALTAAEARIAALEAERWRSCDDCAHWVGRRGVNQYQGGRCESGLTCDGKATPNYFHCDDWQPLPAPPESSR